MSASVFNLHGNKTADGRLIVVGMRVLDYDHKLGTVVEDETREYLFCGPGYCRMDHWFTVESDDGGRKAFNGERLMSRP